MCLTTGAFRSIMPISRKGTNLISLKGCDEDGQPKNTSQRVDVWWKSAVFGKDLSLPSRKPESRNGK